MVAESPDLERLTPVDVAEYIVAMAGELSTMAEAARLDGVATILFAAQLEAKRALQRIEGDSAAKRRRRG